MRRPPYGGRRMERALRHVRRRCGAAHFFAIRALHASTTMLWSTRGVRRLRDVVDARSAHIAKRAHQWNAMPH
eukprot:10152262-Lingulodinium_polyedra.AAC.1